MFTAFPLLGLLRRSSLQPLLPPRPCVLPGGFLGQSLTDCGRGQPGFHWNYWSTADKGKVFPMDTGKADREEILWESDFEEILEKRASRCNAQKCTYQIIYLCRWKWQKYGLNQFCCVLWVGSLWRNFNRFQYRYKLLLGYFWAHFFDRFQAKVDF